MEFAAAIKRVSVIDDGFFLQQVGLLYHTSFESWSEFWAVYRWVYDNFGLY
jgi:hypothetical protein